MVSGNRQLGSDCLWKQRSVFWPVQGRNPEKHLVLLSSHPREVCVCFWNSHPFPHLSGCESMTKTVLSGALKRYSVSVPSVKVLRSLQCVVLLPNIKTLGKGKEAERQAYCSVHCSLPGSTRGFVWDPWFTHSLLSCLEPGFSQAGLSQHPCHTDMV